MSKSLKPYINSIEYALESAICLRNFPSQICERHNKPEIEIQTSKELILEPKIISRSDEERCLIESSINSARVSIKLKDADPIEKVLGKQYLGFLMRRAEDFVIMRRVPVKGYSISFLILDRHINEQFTKRELIDFILHFIVDIDKEISSLKIDLNSRGRAIAAEYWKQFA